MFVMERNDRIHVELAGNVMYVYLLLAQVVPVQMYM